MELLLSVDTNDYGDDPETLNPACPPEIDAEWSLFGLWLATFQNWTTAGQTNFWTVEGDIYCGTRYRCEINYRDELLLRCLVSKIREYCKDRFMSLSINNLPVEFTDDDLMNMRREWIETMKGN